MIFVDANIPMYLVGGDHRHKVEARYELERLVREGRRLITSSEIFQEMLHRYTSIDRRNWIEPAFETLRGMVDDVLAVEEQDVFDTKDLVRGHERLSARDALHVAVMRHHRVAEIVSFDTGFDAVIGIRRLPASPAGS